MSKRKHPDVFEDEPSSKSNKKKTPIVCCVCFEEDTLIGCQRCESSACRECWFKYFETTIPNSGLIKCVSCSDVLPMGFLINLSLTTHEKILLCNTMKKEYCWKKEQERQKDQRPIGIQRQINELDKKGRDLTLELRELQDHVTKISDQIVEITKKKCDAQKMLSSIVSSDIACGTPDCGGRVSINTELCSKCEQRTCPKCYGTKAHDHECDKATISSLEMIFAECRQCAKCGTLTYKDGGCSHVWCTICKTYYDFATGKHIKISSDRNINTPAANEARNRGENITPILLPFDIEEVIETFDDIDKRMLHKRDSFSFSSKRYFGEFHTLSKKLIGSFRRHVNNKRKVPEKIRDIGERIKFLDGEIPLDQFKTLLLTRHNKEFVQSVLLHGDIFSLV